MSVNTLASANINDAFYFPSEEIEKEPEFTFNYFLKNDQYEIVIVTETSSIPSAIIPGPNGLSREHSFKRLFMYDRTRENHEVYNRYQECCESIPKCIYGHDGKRIQIQTNDGMNHVKFRFFDKMYSLTYPVSNTEYGSSSIDGVELTYSSQHDLNSTFMEFVHYKLKNRFGVFNDEKQ